MLYSKIDLQILCFKIGKKRAERFQSVVTPLTQLLVVTSVCEKLLKQ